MHSLNKETEIFPVNVSIIMKIYLSLYCNNSVEWKTVPRLIFDFRKMLVRRQWKCYAFNKNEQDCAVLMATI
jgi:hypothetical protein